MATVGEGLKANIRITGTVDQSWRNGVGQIKDGLLGITKQTKTLTSQQQKLAQQIKKAALEGKDVSKMRTRYEALGKKIASATQEQTRLNKQLQKAETLTKWMRRGAGVAKFAGGGLLLGGGLLAAGATAAFRINSQTAEQDAKARSYGVDYTTFQAWEGIAKTLGLNGENVGDLPEEMAHKIGEYKATGKMGAFEDAMMTLGMTGKDLDGLTNQEMFEKIMNNAANMADFQKASFVVDDLMGGEASKFIQLMRQTGKTWQELEDEQKRYILTTKEGAQGATEGSRATDRLLTVFSSGIAEVSGLLGHRMAPSITDISNQLADWFRSGGIKTMSDFVGDTLLPNLMAAGESVYEFGVAVAKFAGEVLEWLPDDTKEKRAGQESLIRSVASGNASPSMAAASARELDLDEAFIKTLTDPKTVEALRNQWNQNKAAGLLGDAEANRRLYELGGIDEVPEVLSYDEKVDRNRRMINQVMNPGETPRGLYDLRSDTTQFGSQPPVTVRSEPKISAVFNITQQPGEDGEALGQRVSGELGTVYAKYADQVW